VGEGVGDGGEEEGCIKDNKYLGPSWFKGVFWGGRGGVRRRLYRPSRPIALGIPV
jgi:hypothetical protein